VPKRAFAPFSKPFFGFFLPNTPCGGKTFDGQNGFCEFFGFYFFLGLRPNGKKTLVGLVCWAEFLPSDKTPFSSPDGADGVVFC